MADGTPSVTANPHSFTLPIHGDVLLRYKRQWGRNTAGYAGQANSVQACNHSWPDENLVGVGWSTKLAHKRPLKPPLELSKPACIALVSLVQVGTARCRVASCRPLPADLHRGAKPDLITLTDQVSPVVTYRVARPSLRPGSGKQKHKAHVRFSELLLFMKSEMQDAPTIFLAMETC